jgi:peroxiredoxin Q/BCP
VEIDTKVKEFNINENLKLSELLSQRKAVVLLFFFEASNLGCVAEIKSYRDIYHQFKEISCEIIGITTDLDDNLTQLTENLSLEFPLISDTDGKICSEYNTLGKGEAVTNPKTLRRTIVIDKNMQVIGFYQNISPVNHALEVYDMIVNHLRFPSKKKEKDGLLQDVNLTSEISDL